MRSIAGHATGLKQLRERKLQIALDPDRLVLHCQLAWITGHGVRLAGISRPLMRHVMWGVVPVFVRGGGNWDHPIKGP